MKKITYILSGIVVGAVLTTTTAAMADQVKSLIGKKVAGEYSVNANGTVLSDKAIIVDSKAYVPLRSVSSTLGASLKIDGKTVIITSPKAPDGTPTAPATNKYSGKSKTEIEASIKILKEDILKEATDARDRIVTEIQRLKSANAPEMIPFWETQLKEAEINITKVKADIAEAEAALAAAK